MPDLDEQESLQAAQKAGRILKGHADKHLYRLDTVGPLIIESLRAKKRVSTGALRALDDPLVVQTKI